VLALKLPNTYTARPSPRNGRDGRGSSIGQRFLTGGFARALAFAALASTGFAQPQAVKAPAGPSMVGSAVVQTNPQVPEQTSEPGFRDRVVREGIAVDVSLEPLDPAAGGGLHEGQDVRFRFQVSDTTTNSPLSAVFPAAWMDHLVRGVETDVRDCKQKVEELVGGSIRSRVELDLNVYYVLALNDDAGISVVDPFFGFGDSKLLTMIVLESPGEDWVLSADRKRLFVSMPTAGKVAVVDTATWKIITNVEVSAPGPRRVALQPDGRYLWVSYEGETGSVSGVAVFDAERLTTEAMIPTGRGRHEITFSENSRYAFVSNREEGTVAIIDVRELRSIAVAEVGERPVSLDYSALGQAAYVADQGQGTVSVVEAPSGRVRARIAVDPGVGQIRFAPGERYAFAVNPSKNVFYVIDGASNRIVQVGDVDASPDQVTFSDENAYIRQRDSEIVWMTPLDEVGKEGTPVSIIDLPAGQHALGAGGEPSPAAGIVQAPGATAVLVANPADKAIYYYKEGMAAPMGHFKNFGRQPRAVLVVDRSLKERSPGSYETVAKLTRPGRYSLAFYLDQPLMVHCFDVTVQADAKLSRMRRESLGAVVRPFSTGPARVGETLELRFELTDPVSGQPLAEVPDVYVRSYKSPGTRLCEGADEHAERVGPGVYEVRCKPRQAGRYYVYVKSESLGLPYTGVPSIEVVP